MMKLFKQLAFIAAFGGGVLLFANTEWDQWVSQKQAAFQQDLPTAPQSTETKVHENRSGMVNVQVVKIIAAIQELQQINQRLEELSSILSRGFVSDETKDALGEAKGLMFQRIAIYKRTIRECPMLLQKNDDEIYRINVRGEQSFATAPMMKLILEQEAFKRINAELFE
jgi:hypothetical protein